MVSNGWGFVVVKILKQERVGHVLRKTVARNTFVLQVRNVGCVLYCSTLQNLLRDLMYLIRICYLVTWMS
jgi:hypothetical protein